MHYHLPTALIDAGTREREWAAVQDFSNLYPGFSSTTTTASPVAALTAGWYLLSDGFSIGQIRTVAPLDATKRSLIVVFANAQVNNVGILGEDFQLGLQTAFAAFKLMYKLVGSPTLYSMDESVGFINSFVSFTRAPSAGPLDYLFDGDQARERAEVHVMGVLDLRTVPLGAQIEYFALYGSNISPPVSGLPIFPFNLTFFKMRRASILALQMRP
jgi:hypothetical protein